MDREKQKKKRLIKLILTEAVMVVFVVVLVGVLLLLAMGYKLTADGQVDQSGLVQIETMPIGAEVMIDDEKLSVATNLNKLVTAGTHMIELSKEGYFGWEKTVDITAGRIAKLDYIRLYRVDRPVETVRTFAAGLAFLSVAPDDNSLLYAESGEQAWRWTWLEIKNDEVVETEVEIAAVFGEIADKTAEETEGEIPEIEILALEWNENGNKVLVKYLTEENKIINWAVVDLKNPANSVLLTKTYSLKFEEVKFLNGAGDKLWVTENGNLRTVTLSEKMVSSVLVTGVESFDNYLSTVIMVKNYGESKSIELYRDGESETVMIREKTDSTEVAVAYTEYLGESFYGAVDGARLFVWFGKDLTLLLERDLAVDGGYSLERAGARQFLVACQGGRIAVFDAETGALGEFDLGTTEITWVDNWTLAGFEGGKMTLVEFDGANRRVDFTKASATASGANSAGFEATINGNGRWLYYAFAIETGVEIRREKLVL